MRMLRSYIVLTVLWLTYFWSFSCQFVIIALTPAIRESLVLSTAATGLLIGSYSLGSVSGSFGSGFLCARLGRVRVILLGAVTCAFCMLLVSLSTSYLPLLIAEALLGIGSHVYQPAGLSILSDLFSSKERGKYVGIHEMAVPTGSTFAPIAASLMLGFGLSWNRSFQVWVIPSIFLILGQLMFLRGQEEQRPPENEQTSKTVGGGALKFGSLPLVLLTAALFLKNVSGAENSLLPVYWVSDLGVEVGTAAFIYGGMRVFAILGQFGAGYLSDIFGRLRVLLAIQVLTALMLIPLSYLPFGSLMFASFAGYSVLSMGYMPVMFALISDIAESRERSKMIGTVFALGTTSNIISPTIVGLLAENYSFRTAWLYPIVSSFMALPFLILLKSRLKRTR